ncbi:hypothetical protein niasHS_001058 [Heterodera schachtii]|uniref:Protein kinase domain-containing protein n=1 Tax=Heterodera schachtii TaxID=97005 RepID=A0ABD2K8N6_HETSC
MLNLDAKEKSYHGKACWGPNVWGPNVRAQTWGPNREGPTDGFRDQAKTSGTERVYALSVNARGLMIYVNSSAKQWTVHRGPQLRGFPNNRSAVRRPLSEHRSFSLHRWKGAAALLMIVMELATDLRRYLDMSRRHRLNASAKLFMCLGAAAGLDHIHSKGIIHCDIAAKNCLYADRMFSKGENLGLRHDTQGHDEEDGRQFEHQTDVAGSPDEEQFYRKTSIWAYGVLCWEIFMDGASPPRMLNGHRLQFPHDAPQKFVKFVMLHVWDTKTNNRYSMGAVYDWLKQHTEEGGRRRQQN